MTLKGRNPYFIGINSAILSRYNLKTEYKCRNPYFIGINSAMLCSEQLGIYKPTSQSLFYWN